MPRKASTDEHDPNLVAVGERIKQARRVARLEQKDLAELVGVTDKTISNWETGRFSPYRNIKALSRALNVSESYIWHGDGEPINSDRICRLLEEILATQHRQLDELRLLRLDLFRQVVPT